MLSVDGDIDLKGILAGRSEGLAAEGAYLLIRRSEDLPFTEANVKRRADEFYIGSVFCRTLDNYDVDGTSEGGRI